MQHLQQFTVVDSRLQAGRGEEFSASRQKEKQELDHAQQAYTDADTWHLPIGHRAEDSLDTEGLTMASVETAIPENNKGFQMLQKMGWKGNGLGRNETGIVEPVRSGVEAGVRLGLGKQEQENFYMDADNVYRKKLEVELQAEEDQDRRDKREMQAERDERIRQDVSTIQKSFYCQTCNKQYKNAFEMEAHISSYDHHHKKRLIEMRTDEAERTRGIRERKEKKRADKEMARLQAQIQAAQAAAAPAIPADTIPVPPALPPLPPADDAYPPPPPPPEPEGAPLPPLPAASPQQLPQQFPHHSQAYSHRHQTPSQGCSVQQASNQQHRHHSSPGVLAALGTSQQSQSVQIKTEPGGLKQEPNSSSGLQFGFGGLKGQPAKPMSIAKKTNRIVSKKALPSAKPAIAAFNMKDSDDEAE